MKKIFLTSLMLMLALFINEKAQSQIAVNIANGFPDNCTIGAVVGTYTQTGTLNGKPVYTSTNGKTISWRPTVYQSVPANSWHLWDVGGTFSLYYSNVNTPTPPCASVANPSSLWTGTFGCFQIEVAGPSCAIPPTTGTLSGPINTYFNTTLFTVTFATSVTGLTASNFATVLGPGVTSATVTAVYGSGTTWYVDVNSVGIGTYQLQMANTTGTSPVVAVPFLSNTVTTNALTPGSLAVGDIGFTSYFSDASPDQFSFVTLASLPANTTIYFTDNAWTGSAVRETESIIGWNSGSNVINPGTQITITGLTSSMGTVTNIADAPSGLGMGSAGDQILAFQGSTPSFITGIHMNVNTTAPITNASSWESPISTSSTSCAKPSSLSTGVNAFWHTVEFDNGKVNCSGLPVANVSLLRAYVNTPANWVFDDDMLTIGNSFPSCSFLVPCINPTVPTITYTPATVCEGSTATLQINGTLNSATEWGVYTGSCGGTLAFSIAGNTAAVNPGSGGETYYVRGEGGCVSVGGPCGTVTVITTPLDDASFSYTANTFCSNSSDPTPTITGLLGGIFSSTPSGLSINPTTGTIDISASAPGNYTVSYGTNGICPNSSSTTITVLAQASATIMATATPSSICIGASAVLNTTLPPQTGPAIDPVPACFPNYSLGNGSGDFIANVTFGVINNITGPNTVASNTFYPTPVVTVIKNNSYSLSVQVGTYSMNDVAVWIDFNRDGDFDDAGEKVGESDDNGANAIVNFTVTIPTFAQLGYTRMRIVEADQGSSGGMLPCSGYTYGESEDYQINIESNPPIPAWTGPANIDNTSSATTNVTPILPGGLIYTVSVLDGNGCVATSSVNLSVNTLPNITVSASPSNTVCSGSPVTLQGSGAATYSWNPGGLTGSSVSVNPTANTIYTVTGTNAAGCSNTQIALVYVLSIPTLGTASVSPPLICLGGNVSLSYTPPSGSACNGSHANGFTGTYLPSNWQVTQTNSNGSINTSGAPASITFTSSNNNSLSAGIDDFQITLPCSGILSFNWSYSTVDNPFYDYPRYTINGGSPTFFDGYNSSGSNTQSGTQYIVVNAGDVLTLSMYSLDNQFGSATSIISNFVAPVLTSTTQSVTWFSAAVGGSNLGSGNPQSITPAAIGSFNYYAQVSNSLGCVNPTRMATNLLSVLPLPTANAGADKTLTCTSPSATIGTAAIGGNTYSWSPATALSSANIALPTCTATTTTSYTVTVTNSTTSCTATDVVLVTVNKTPPTANAGLDKSLTCTTPSATIGTAAIGGNSYSWLPTTALSATNIAIPTSSATATTTYTVTVTNTSNGCSATDAVLVSVNKTPPTANAGLDITLNCTTPSSTIGTAAVAGNTYAWLPTTALSATNIAIPTSSATATTTYTVTVTNTSNGCSATDAVLVTVDKTPPTANAGLDKTLNCTTPSSTIGTAAVAGNTYAWLPTTALSASNIALPTSSATATTTYTVTVTTTANGCTATDAVLVSVNKTPPTVATTATATSIACGASTSLTGTGATTYTWQPGALSGTTVTVSPTVTTTYTVTGTAANGCTATATRLITVGPCGSVLNVKAYMEGYYIGGGLMTPALFNQLVPGTNSTQADTITVELRNATFPYGLVATQKRILNTNGTSTGSFAVSGTYYIVVKNRHLVETWSATPVSVSGTTSYDFSNAQTKAFGSNQVLVSPGVWAMYSGDISQDGSIDALDYLILDPDIQNGASGYLNTDLNGDGSIDALDYLILDINVGNGVTVNAP